MTSPATVRVASEYPLMTTPKKAPRSGESISRAVEYCQACWNTEATMLTSAGILLAAVKSPAATTPLPHRTTYRPETLTSHHDSRLGTSGRL